MIYVGVRIGVCSSVSDRFYVGVRIGVCSSVSGRFYVGVRIGVIGVGLGVLRREPYQTRTLALWGDLCLDAVSCEGSRLTRQPWILCSEILQGDSVGSGCCGLEITC